MFFVVKNRFYKSEIDFRPLDLMMIIAMNDRDLMMFNQIVASFDSSDIHPTVVIDR